MLSRKISFRLCKSILHAPLRSRLLATQSILVEEMVETRRSSLQPEPELPTLEQAVANLRQSSDSAFRPVSSKHAAVLVPLFESEGDIHVILTQRSSKMRKHAGEVCFPGGKREPDDADDVATALREAQEELGIDPGCVEIVVTMPPVLSKHLLSVTPVVATVPQGMRFTPSPAEVRKAFLIKKLYFIAAYFTLFRT